ncbi:MAG: hypothetical protein Q8L02_00355 [Candidatus Nitrotoga sp.]|nr:hypothetical protein [Candidatus Nitrotoga sp.]
MPTSDAPQQLVNAALSPVQVMYADRITNFGIGISVSRLTLAMEIGKDNFAPHVQLIIPTPALFEALEFMATAITNNDSIKKDIINALDAFKEKLAKTSE